MRWIRAIVGAAVLVGALGVPPVAASSGREAREPAAPAPAAPVDPVAPAPTASAPADTGPLEVYTGRLDARTLGALRDAGVDVQELVAPAGSGAEAPVVEVVLSAAQARDLATAGVAVEPKLVDGLTSSEAATASDGDGVFRPYSGAGGLKDELWYGEPGAGDARATGTARPAARATPVAPR